MKLLLSISIAAFPLIVGQAHARASTKSETQVTAAKGPVQITLRVHKTTVKAEKSLWYKLELKNIGKKKILIEDRFYKDAWVIHENSKVQRRLYLEVTDPQGKLLKVRRVGAGQSTFDWEPKRGEMVPFSPEEQREFDAVVADLKKRGLTAQEQSIALSDWNSKNNDKKNMAELSDPAKQLWLPPGASTTTFAWAYTDPDEYADHSTDEIQIGDYTQLWSFKLAKPGTYCIRAIYNHASSKSHQKEMAARYQLYPEDWEVEVKTPCVKFTVRP